MCTVLQTTLHFNLSRHLNFALAVITLLLLSTCDCQFLHRKFFPSVICSRLCVRCGLPRNGGSAHITGSLGRVRTCLGAQGRVAGIATSVNKAPKHCGLIQDVTGPSLTCKRLVVSFASPSRLIRGVSRVRRFLAQRCPSTCIGLGHCGLVFGGCPVRTRFLKPSPTILRHLTSDTQRVVRGAPRIYLVAAS